MNIENLPDFNKYKDLLRSIHVLKGIGKVTEVRGALVRGYVPRACIGSLVAINSPRAETYLAEVVGFNGKSVLMMPFGETQGISFGERVDLLRSEATVALGDELLGRVINSQGAALDNLGDLNTKTEQAIYKSGQNPLQRELITEPLDVGIRAINGLLSFGKGQRVGIMAGSGVGKSVLMGMMARGTSADVNVIALIGERGREVREFIESDLGKEGLKRSVVVVATGDESPLMRMRGAFVAKTVAEYFANQGKDVLLMMDSVTRFAMAQREIGLSMGEPPTTKGYTPTVFGLLPRLLERAGCFQNGGSITGIYTVLVEGDDLGDPIGDSVRSIVDGHIVLSRSLAAKGHFPAIDVLNSTSRVMHRVVSPSQVQAAQLIRQNIGAYKEAEDLINIGAYKKGLNPQVDQAIDLRQPINDYLQQSMDDIVGFDQSLHALARIVGGQI